MSFNAVDTFFVAQLGDDPLAAMAFTFPVIMVITSVAIGLGAGASSTISRAIGSGNQDKVRRLATDAISLATIISVAVCAIGWITIDPLFLLLGATENLLPLIHDYMSIWYLSAPFLMVPMIGLSALRALGFSKIQGNLMLGAAILNAILDPLLIFGYWGFPRLEIEGAAWASLITRIMMLIGAIIFLQRRLQVITNPFVHYSHIIASWRSLMHVGLPAMMSNLIIPIASGVVVVLVSSFGTDAVAGLGVAVRIEPIALIVFYALSGVVGPFCGQNHGAGYFNRMLEAVNVVTRFCLLFGLLLAAVLWFVGPIIARYFSESDEIWKVAVLYLTIVPISYGAYGLVMSVIAIFNGLGLPTPGFSVSFLRVIGVYLPIAFIGKYFWGIQGLFIATCVTNLAVAVIAVTWLRKTLLDLERRTNSLSESDAVAAQ
jgi:putative MATE family efflux protein